MKKNEITAIISNITKLREILTDEQACQVPTIFPAWKPESSYLSGARICYENTVCKCIEDHKSGKEFQETYWITL